MPIDATGNADALHTDHRWVRMAGILCAATAFVSATLLGGLELWRPVFSGVARYTLTPATPAQLWAYGIVQAIKAIVFTAALAGILVVATRRGPVATMVTRLAAAGAAFFALVWLMIAGTGRDDAVYFAGHALGSDGRTNGGILFLWIAPIVLGVSAVRPHRIPRWQSAWLIGTGILGSRVFVMFPVGVAFVIEGILWLVVGGIVYARGRGT